MAIDRAAAANAIDAFLRAIGRDPESDPDLRGTGERVADAYVDELCAGYAVDTRALLAASAIAVPEGRGGLVIVRDVAITTMCPHHLLPAQGTATVAMQTNRQLLGLGTLVSLVKAHARRLTLQERIGDAVVADIMTALEPEWAGCKLMLVHGCMAARGERAVGSRVETVAVRTASNEASPRAATLQYIYTALGVGR